MKPKVNLEYEREPIAKFVGEKEIEEANKYCEGYKAFINQAKTEREAVSISIEMAQKLGFKEYNFDRVLKAGDSVYIDNRKKSLVLIKVGSSSIEEGANLIVAHVDSPRLDLKPRPIFEDGGFAYFNTHYYGGIKKYQWPTIPLALHGVVIKKDGTPVNIKIGEDENDPVFCITDLLPHLAQKQSEKKLSEAIEGEDLDILIGSHPLKEDDIKSLHVKRNILKLLYEKYGITERDFLTAELEIVPAQKARDVGLDASMIGAYGHDDKVCAYPALKAILELKNNKKTAIVILGDKEEIGCQGITAPSPLFIRDIIAELCRKENKSKYKALANSACLSADVSSAFDPHFPDVFDRRNSNKLSNGIAVEKYGGARGKSGSSDASAEFVHKICKLFDDNKIIWQMGEIGKVDVGGGGTFAADVAQAGIEVLDVGIPILSMHSPFEIASKLDIYMLNLAYCAFLGKF